MKINAINNVYLQKTNAMRKVSTNHQVSRISQNHNVDSVNFEGGTGKMVGGLTGMTVGCGIALATLAAGPFGLAAAATYLAAGVGSTVIGGAIGDAIERKRKDDEGD